MNPAARYRTMLHTTYFEGRGDSVKPPPRARSGIRGGQRAVSGVSGERTVVGGGEALSASVEPPRLALGNHADEVPLAQAELVLGVGCAVVHGDDLPFLVVKSSSFEPWEGKHYLETGKALSRTSLGTCSSASLRSPASQSVHAHTGKELPCFGADLQRQR